MSWFTDLAGKAEDFLNKVDAGAATALQKENALAAEYGGDPSLSVYATSGYRTDGPGMQQNYESLHDPPGFITAAAGNIKRSNAPLFSNASNVSSTNPDTTTPLGSSSVGATSSTNTGRASSGFVRRKKSEQDVDDDMLFDFLNSSDPPAATSDRKDVRRDLPKVSVPVVEPQAPPSTSTPMSSALASGTSTPHSALGISRASSLSSLSTHSMKTSEEGLARDPGRGRSLF